MSKKGKTQRNGKNIIITINSENGYKLSAFERPQLEEGENQKEVTRDVQSISIKLATRVTGESNLGNGRLYNSAAITSYGYGEGSNYVPAENIGVDRDSKQGNAGSLIIYKHKTNYVEVEKDNDMSNIEKNNLQQEDDDDMDCVVVSPKGQLDLALRKFIYKVENDERNITNYSKEENRVPLINESSVIELETSEDDNKTAKYIHSKNVVSANIGAEVTYRIRVYNEGSDGDYAGLATQITDYLPVGLEFSRIETGFDDWSLEPEIEQQIEQGGKPRIIKLKYTPVSGTVGERVVAGNKLDQILQPGSIYEIADINEGKKTGNKEDYYQEVGVVCTVVGNETLKQTKGKEILTNRAAITDHMACDENGNEVPQYDDSNNKIRFPDRDSEPEQLTDENFSYWDSQENENSVDLDSWYEKQMQNHSDQPYDYYPGVQDDDDFDSIVVKRSGTYSLNFLKLNRAVIEPKEPQQGIEYLEGQSLEGAEYLIYQLKDMPQTDFTIYQNLMYVMNKNENFVNKYIVKTLANGEIEVYDVNANDEKGNRLAVNPFNDIPITSTRADAYVIKEIKAPERYYNSYSTANKGFIIQKEEKDNTYVLRTSEEIDGVIVEQGTEVVGRESIGEGIVQLGDFSSNGESITSYVTYYAEGNSGKRVLNTDGSRYYYFYDNSSSARRVDFEGNNIIFSLIEPVDNVKKTIDVSKKWDLSDGELADNYRVTFQLFKIENDEEKPLQQVTVTGNTIARFANTVPIYDDYGDEIEYLVKEIKIEKKNENGTWVPLALNKFKTNVSE